MKRNWKGKIKPRPNDYYESAAEMTKNNNYWLKQYEKDLKDWEQDNNKQHLIYNKQLTKQL